VSAVARSAAETSFHRQTSTKIRKTCPQSIRNTSFCPSLWHQAHTFIEQLFRIENHVFTIAEDLASLRIMLSRAEL
jgi:hypothetical protein